LFGRVVRIRTAIPLRQVHALLWVPSSTAHGNWDPVDETCLLVSQQHLTSLSVLLVMPAKYANMVCHFIKSIDGWGGPSER